MPRRKNKKHYQRYKEEARLLVHARLSHYNAQYGFLLRRIAIKDSVSRWGSCSKKGNLNFNYRILFLPLPVADYIVVHELCHLAHFNHSREFWSLVSKAMPDYMTRRQALRGLERGASAAVRPFANRGRMIERSHGAG